MRSELPLKASHQSCLMATNGRIATAEQTLPRKTRTMLPQLRTGHSRMFGQYMKRIDPTTHNHCHDCGHSPNDIHHLFDCLSKPTTLTVESLWTVPTETAKHLHLAIDETIWQLEMKRQSHGVTTLMSADIDNKIMKVVWKTY